MKKKSKVLSILMNGLLVGRLEKTVSRELIFTYDQSWLIRPAARPISLSLPLLDRSYVGEVVYHFFDNLLPDNPQIRARIQSRFGVSSNHPFDLLALIGRDCVGAIQVTDFESSKLENHLQFKPLNEKKIASILRGHSSYPLGMTDEFEEFRLSIAGAQEKTAFLYHKNKWNVPLGTTPTSHIFKLPIGFIPHQQLDLHDSCENEWLCSKIADAFGIAVAPCEILYFEDMKVLAVERFDRKWSSKPTWLMRLPQEDLCQALGVSPHLKYQAEGGPGINEIMRLLLGSVNPMEERDAFYRAQVLFWLLAAIDGHAKNFSLFIEPGGKYQLTPLYDVMSAHPLIAKKQLQSKKIKMAMALKEKNNHYHWHDIQRRHFMGAAKAALYSIARAEILLDEMLEQVDSVIDRVSENMPNTIPVEISQPIFDGMRRMRNRLMKCDRNF